MSGQFHAPPALSPG